jgi:hypothetical protein
MEPKDTITISNLNDLIDGYETITIGGYSDPQYGAVPGANVTIGSPNVYSLGSNSSPYTISATGGPYTINSGAGTNSLWATYNPAPKIKLDGEGADIEVNGWSLVAAIKQIEERLNILTPSAELETEWAELKALGDQYRKLEQHIKDKQATWDRLKAMPPPEVE